MGQSNKLARGGARRIGGAGACHSDLHVMHGWSPAVIRLLAGWQLPFTLGHKSTGWIEGGETAGMEIGTPVVISHIWGCGKCRSCRSCAEDYCDNPNPAASGGLGRNGGLAEYIVVPVSAMVPLNTLEPADAAPLPDASLTSYRAVKQCLPILTPDTGAVVIGVGGLGHLAVEFLSVLSGAQITAVDRDQKALKLAAEKGADLCLPSDETAVKQIKDATRGLGAMAILDSSVLLSKMWTLSIGNCRQTKCQGGLCSYLRVRVVLSCYLAGNRP